MYSVTTKTSLTFVLEGREQLMALKAKVKIEKSDIVNMQWYDAFNDWSRLLVRMPGSYLPKWVMAGSYWQESGWDFVLARKPRGMLQPTLFDVLVVETKKDRYRRVIMRMDQDKANEIIKWWKAKK